MPTGDFKFTFIQSASQTHFLSFTFDGIYFVLLLQTFFKCVNTNRSLSQNLKCDSTLFGGFVEKRNKKDQTIDDVSNRTISFHVDGRFSCYFF